MEGYSHWYNLDLSETMAVRARLLPENGRISQIAMSAMEDWGGEIKESDAPVLVIIEGLTMYLSKADFRFLEEHNLVEGMAVFLPVYRWLGKIPPVRSISNKILVLEK